MKADKCLHCHKGVRKVGDFSGSYYPVERTTENGQDSEEHDKVHLECWEAYEAELAERRNQATAA